MTRSPAHPVFLAAGVAVLIFSGLGTAALMGWLPSATSRSEPTTAVAQAPGAAPSAPKSAPAPAPAAKKGVPACPTCGVIESVQTAQVQGEASGVGAVAGGVAGAVVGNQFGHGTTNTVLTIGGAAAGAFAGNQVEKHVKRKTVYRVAVRLEDGTLRTLTQSAAPPFAVGDRVRIVNGNTLERA